MARKPRFSHQRETIFNIIAGDEGHLSAEQIYELARKQVPNISLGTVYRNLNALEEVQKVSKTQGAKQVTYYEVFKAPHHHFICEDCEGIWNLDTPTSAFCKSCITDSSNKTYSIDKAIMTLYGKCESCMPKEAQVEEQLIQLHG